MNERSASETDYFIVFSSVSVTVAIKVFSLPFAWYIAPIIYYRVPVYLMLI
jgi:hypothetical protein